MRYKPNTLTEERTSNEEVISQRENRLIIERIQQKKWEDAGRDWKVYLSSIEWDDTQHLKRKVKKQREIHPFQKFL